MRNKYIRKLQIELVDGEYENPVEGQVRTPEQVYEVFKKLKDHAEESLLGVYLDAELVVNTYAVLSVGSASETTMAEDEIWSHAILTRSKYVILIHNHPSGNPEPSPSDREVIGLLVRQARTLKRHLLDFIVVGKDSYWSLFEEYDGGDYDLGAVV